ncbi:MAG: hypothetical protein U5K27_04690 [Desulfotignum sp.]|nr:hypothetical protein [Desulfotignum sp.]
MALEFIMVLTTPTVFVLLKLIEAIAWLLDAIIYGYFLGLRFFAILILKFTGPAAIALSLLPKFGHVFGKWVALYARWWLLIIPFAFRWILLRNGFMEAYDEIMFDEYGKKPHRVLLSTKMAVNDVAIPTQIPLLVLVTLLKLARYIYLR